MKVTKLHILLLSIATLSAMAFSVDPISAQDQKLAIIKTLVIDPGHGGKDPGTISKTSMEKDIVLSVALKFGELVKKNYPEVKVIYTRSTDVFIPLANRGEIANKAGADLFMSIHVNGVKNNTTASGTETYVMGISKSRDNLNVAMRENDVVTYESDYSTKYQGYEPGSAESFIIFTLMQYSHREQSMALADLIQKQYIKNIKSVNRGVKEDGFFVLWHTAMPAILTELGFISNREDEKLMISKQGQERYARCLFNAFSAYKTKADGAGHLIVLDQEEQSEDEQDQVLAQEQPSQINPAKQETEKPSKPETTKQDKAQPSQNTTPIPTGKTDIKTQNIKKGVVFAVQAAISPTPLKNDNRRFGSYCTGEIHEKKVGSIYKYYVELCDSYQDVTIAVSKVRKEIKDAFVVAFQDGELIPVSKAIKLIENK